MDVFWCAETTPAHQSLLESFLVVNCNVTLLGKKNALKSGQGYDKLVI